MKDHESSRHLPLIYKTTVTRLCDNSAFFEYKTHTQGKANGNDLQEKAYQRSMTPRASATQAPNMYDDMEHNEFKKFLESPSCCAECADKDAIITGLRRLNAQFAALLEASRANSTPSG